MFPPFFSMALLLLLFNFIIVELFIYYIKSPLFIFELLKKNNISTLHIRHFRVIHDQLFFLFASHGILRLTKTYIKINLQFGWNP